jgi:hypothetical protein
MMDKEQFDFWYAVNNTAVLHRPAAPLETFGTTVLHYHLISELMDVANQVRVREGRLEAYRPQIITPQSFAQTLLEGFGGAAQEYVQWLRAHEESLHILKYGFAIRKQERSEYVVADDIRNVTGRLLDELKGRNDPLSALAIGVDRPWEVSLVKLMVDVVESSLAGNIRDLKAKDLFNRARLDPTGARARIEDLFRTAEREPSRISELGERLVQEGLFREYEDRFFALLRGRKPGS